VSAGELLGKAVDVVEVAVGLVLVLLVQFIVVEALVVECCGLGRSGRANGSMVGNRSLLGRNGERNCVRTSASFYSTQGSRGQAKQS
jgi:hypothetical protein